jgi:serine/threonine protein kinase
MANPKMIEKNKNGILGILGITLDIAFAIRAIHLHKFAHCDIKPENCLVLLSLDGKVVVKVADFGSIVPSMETERCGGAQRLQDP